MEPVVFEKVKMVSGPGFALCGWPRVCWCVWRGRGVGLIAYCSTAPGAQGGGRVRV